MDNKHKPNQREKIKMDFCPLCNMGSKIVLEERKNTIVIRGEPIEVDVEYYKCSACNEEFEDMHSDNDYMAEAYREYRKRKGLMQPEEIKALRKRYNLTQADLSKILGWGGATISRYENGSLQSESQDNLLRLIESPQELLKLLGHKKGAFPAIKHNALINRIISKEPEDCAVDFAYEQLLSSREPNEYNGYTRFRKDKFINAILYLAKEGVYKTKLNKLLFYFDFKHLKEYAVAVTGMTYAKGTYGPVPDKYEILFAELLEHGSLVAEEEETKYGVVERLKSGIQPDLAVFSNSEIKVLTTIAERFGDMTSEEISDYSHKEPGFVETDIGKYISSGYADKLRF